MVQPVVKGMATADKAKHVAQMNVFFVTFSIPVTVHGPAGLSMGMGCRSKDARTASRRY